MLKAEVPPSHERIIVVNQEQTDGLEIERSIFSGRTLLGYDTADAEHVDGWAAVFSTAARAMNHLTAGASIPAPTTYKVLGEIRVGAQRLPQLCAQLADGLARSLDDFEVYDDAREPGVSVDDARAHLLVAAEHLQRAGEAFDAAQSAINQQGYHTETH